MISAVRSLVRTWLLDTKEAGIWINVLRPSHTLTPGFKDLIPSEAHGGVFDAIPWVASARPEDMGKATVLLASDDSAYVTGIELDVDGGAVQK